MSALLRKRIEQRIAGPLGVVPPLIVFFPLVFGYSTLDQLSDGFGGLTLQKLALVVAMAIVALLLGVRTPPWPVWIISGAVGVAYVIGLITGARGVDGFDSGMLFGAAGLVYPWIVFLIDWRPIKSTWRATALAVVAPITVAFASIMHVSGVLGVEIFRIEYTGAARLSAGMPPAYLAGLALVGVCGGMWLWTMRRWVGFYLAFINLAICVLTTTRVATLAAGLIFVVMIVVGIVRRFPHWTAAVCISLASLIAGAILLLPRFLERMEGTAGGILSGTGRDRAWGFFLDQLMQRPWTGYGPGSGPLLAAQSDDQIIRRAFISPHNNYIDLAIDLGIPLAVAFLGAVVIVLIRVVIRVPFEWRWLVGVTGISALTYATFDNLLTAPQSAVMFVTFLAMVSANVWENSGRFTRAGAVQGATAPSTSQRQVWRARVDGEGGSDARLDRGRLER